MTPNPQDSAVALEVERAIREALDAGPTRGPWRASYDGHGGMRIESLGWQIGYASKAGGKQEANAALIAACNPASMRSLLAEIDRLRASQSDGTSGGWLEIASAPKDGSSVLVNDTTGMCPHCMAHYLDGEEWRGWVYDDDAASDNNPLGPQPTHYMLIGRVPAAPNQGENHGN